MKLFPFQTAHIVAINEDSSRVVIRLRQVPDGVKTSAYDGESYNVHVAVTNPDHPRHRDAITFVTRVMAKTGHGQTGPNHGDNNDGHWYLVAADTADVRAKKPEWFARKNDDLLAVFARMQQDAVIPPAEALSASELVTAKRLWSLKLSGRLEETRVERARAAQAYADQKIGISTAGSHVLD